MDVEKVGKNSFETCLVDKADLYQLADVYTRSYQLGEWTQSAALEYMEWWFKRQPDLFYMAKKPTSGVIIGGVVAAIKPLQGKKHLADFEIFVDPIVQNLSVGTVLTVAILNEAIRKYKIERVEGIVSESSGLIAVYEKYGFKLTGWVEADGNPQEILEKLNQQV